MKSINKTQFFNTIISLAISIIHIMAQLFLIYLVINTFGMEINGFVRVSMSLSLIGGSCEGALAIATIAMFVKPIAEKDWLTVNEIYSTSKKKYFNDIITGTFLISVLSVLYPLQVLITPYLISGKPLSWSLSYIINDKTFYITIWELSLIFFIFGFKQIVSGGIYGIYENILQASQEHVIQKICILISDTAIYLLFFFFMNFFIKGIITFSPVYIFLLFLFYPFIRGILIKIYVKNKFPQIKFYDKYNYLNLITNSYKIFYSNIGYNILVNADTFIILIALGGLGLSTSSAISIYVLVGFNIKIILMSFITPFKEYFLTLINNKGRMNWNEYINYELFTYIIASVTFLSISLFTPYIVTGYFSDLLAKKDSTNNMKEINELFTDFALSSLFGFFMSMIMLIDSKLYLIQAKGIANKVTKPLFIISLLFVIIEFFIILSINIILRRNVDLKTLLIVFYTLKNILLMIGYFIVWIISWDRTVYNAKIKHAFSNLIFIVIAILTPIIIYTFTYNNFLYIQKNSEGQYEITALLIAKAFIIFAILLVSQFILLLIVRRKVTINVIKNFSSIIKNREVKTLLIPDKKYDKEIIKNIERELDIKPDNVIIKPVINKTQKEKTFSKKELLSSLKYKDKPNVYTVVEK